MLLISLTCNFNWEAVVAVLIKVWAKQTVKLSTNSSYSLFIKTCDGRVVLIEFRVHALQCLYQRVFGWCLCNFLITAFSVQLAPKTFNSTCLKNVKLIMIAGIKKC